MLQILLQRCNVATKLQQNEKQEVVTTSPCKHSVFTEFVAENKTPLLQQNNSFATKPQQESTKPQQVLHTNLKEQQQSSTKMFYLLQILII